MSGLTEGREEDEMTIITQKCSKITYTITSNRIMLGIGAVTRMKAGGFTPAYSNRW